ncbi:metal-dependent hydrolase family protein [Actinoallomurus acaciae]|uniref:Amidohydrolase family protein n=1 Tax=Actinoallomurus acaciae TaxID=502577 RepID=A0ABV5YLQ6_9ACTN
MTHRGSLTIRRASLVDPDTENVQENTRIRVEDGVVVEVGPDPGGPVASAEVDATGLYALPGLIDCHVHVTAHTVDEHALTMEAPSYVTARAAAELRATLARGFTAVRDMAGADHGLARAVAEGVLPGPRLFAGGKALSQTGGHGDLRPAGQNVHDTHYWTPGLGRVCDGVPEVRRAVRDEIRRGAAHIKLMLSGGCSSPTDRIGSLQFSEEEIVAAVQEASAADVYCAGHAYTSAAVERALRLGVRTIEHGNLIDESVLPLFAGAFYVPTLITYTALVEDGPAHGLSPESRAKTLEVLDGGLHALELADRAGVSIAFGTDLLGPLRTRQPEEFRIRAQVQTPGAILRSATTIAARVLGQEGRLGVIAPQAHADLILTRHDPLSDITHLAEPTEEIALVIQAGTPVPRR